ncbi:response regulator [Stenotrophobium rhamnosiphilum]|uniref:response regulator n=1 Tax=Stenotrophobium rhamnosiphilum TaxID=2029166 RepID=UPI0011B2208E|nr:response regulator transcription factor [Stenotrophobium rhamnosiphilum]
MNVLLVDDHELFRSGLKFLLADLVENISFFEAPSCAVAIELAAKSKFDIVLLDLHLPGVSGLDALALLRERIEEAIIVVVSAEEDRGVIHQIIEAGAAGYIPKASSHAIMMAALRLVLAGGVYLPAHTIAAKLPSQESSTENSHQTAIKNLTERQIATLRIAMQGKANKVIARELNISEATVKAHLSSVFRVLGVRNRTEAVFAAAKIGLYL